VFKKEELEASLSREAATQHSLGLSPKNAEQKGTSAEGGYQISAALGNGEKSHAKTVGPRSRRAGDEPQPKRTSAPDLSGALRAATETCRETKV